MSAVVGALLAVIVVIGPPDPNTGTGSGGGAPSLSGCTKQVADPAGLSSALSSPAPGTKICVTANIPNTRLVINKGGTADAPIQVVGNTHTTTKGITVKANNVVVDGFQVLGAQAPGIELTGNNITARNNTVKHPTGGDFDGMRFFGDNIKVLHNTISDINPDGGSAHADCMQTFATGSDSPASHHLDINGNRCERIDNQCLIAEGPNSSAGDGSGQGQSADITFANNFCDVGASQALEIDDVQNVKVTHNEIAAVGRDGKAFSFQNKSTGALVAANKIADGVGFEVGMDPSSRPGYQGPAPGGKP